jgi:hypothetical protein
MLKQVLQKKKKTPRTNFASGGQWVGMYYDFFYPDVLFRPALLASHGHLLQSVQYFDSVNYLED